MALLLSGTGTTGAGHTANGQNQARWMLEACFALGTLRDVETDFLALFQSLETTHGDGGEMREQVFTAVVGRNEAETPWNR